MRQLGILYTPAALQQNIEAVRKGVAKRPRTSIRHRGQKMDTSRCYLQRIPTKPLLHPHAYKAPLTQELTSTDRACQMDSAEWITEHQQQVNADFSNRFVFLEMRLSAFILMPWQLGFRESKNDC